MTSTLSALLSLALCLCLGMGDKGTFTGPSLWAEPGSLAPLGTNVTLWCRGPAGAEHYLLPRLGNSECRTPSWPGKKVKFPISSVEMEDAGPYCCQYWSQSRWSQCSHPLELVVTGIHEKPTLLALPSSSVGRGEDVTFKCQDRSRLDRFALYKEGEAKTPMSYEWRPQATFPIPAVTAAHGGTYRCYGFSSDSPYHWSAPSDPLKLVVTETSSRPGTQDDPFGEEPTSSNLPRLWEGILTGISLLIAVFFLLLGYYKHLARLKTKGREADGRETPKSCRPAGAMQEQILYTAVKNSRQNRAEDPAAEDFQEVAYAQLALESRASPAWAPPPSPTPHGSSSKLSPAQRRDRREGSSSPDFHLSFP